MTPTPEQLAAVLRYPNAYKGGFWTKDYFGNEAVHLNVDGDDGGVHLHLQTSAHGSGLASMYARLSVEESRELRLALEMAEKAAS